MAFAPTAETGGGRPTALRWIFRSEWQLDVGLASGTVPGSHSFFRVKILTQGVNGLAEYAAVAYKSRFNDLNRVLRDIRVPGYERQSFYERLRNEHPVERVFVMIG